MKSESKIYRISPEGVDQLAWNAAVVTFVLLVVFVSLFTVASGQSADPDQRLRLLIAGSATVVIGLVVIFLGWNWLHKDLATYTLEIGEDYVLRKQEGLRALRLGQEEIVRVREVRGKGLFLKTNQRLRRLFIPIGLAGYEEVRDHISKWKTPEAVSRLGHETRNALGVLGLVIAWLGSWAICVRSPNPAEVVLSAVFFYGFFVLGLADLHRSPNVSKRRKIVFWATSPFLWKFVCLPYLRVLSVLIN